ncbi:hypothetical protein BH747_08605 [Enterococcus villorum]|uniref:Uncharacterized protein n=1 Tax=Enterococcus villorum TaxID=112904 RepID=A0A1V8YBH3_9ENTE|nr:hypothetical protein [Enterococcus villorum]OQO69961.1 hypothetical protein BH747_08605 [Enterococcus villorum]OQO76413.1 hypothetical protein BH744_03115 [Enterococcus villorum]
MNNEILNELKSRNGQQVDKVEELSLGNEEETIHTPEQSEEQVLEHVSTGEDGKMKNQGIEERLHEELENTVLKRKNIEQNASDITLEERMDDLSSYHRDGIESLKKKKQELNKKINEAYKKDSLHEEQTKNDIRELLKLRHQITIRNELQSIFGIDVIDFYRNDYLNNDGNNAKSYINMMDQIEKIMKKEQLIELNNTKKKEFKLTNIEKKNLKKITFL